MEAYPLTKRELFPLLLKLAENPDTRFAYEALAAAPPPWWNSFFPWSPDAQSGSKPFSTSTPCDVNRGRYQSRYPSGKNYIARLKKDGLTGRAYYVWVNSFTPAQRKEWGLLYSGDFDLDPSSWGLGWHIRASHTALITREYSYGDDDSKSLHLRFDRHRGRFNGLY